MHQAVGTSAGVGVPITIAGTIGYMLAGWPAYAPSDFIIFLYPCLRFALLRFAASHGSLANPKILSPFFGRSVVFSFFFNAGPVTAHFPTLQPVEETHAE